MQGEIHLLICVRRMDMYVYMLCVTGSVFCVQLKGISITHKCYVFCLWMTGLHWMAGLPGWQAFVEARTLLEYTVSCTSLHLGKNYDAVCITGSVD